MSSRTSSRSTLTMVPSTMSESLKNLIVLSMAARKSSLEPMSLTATCGEVTVGLGILLGCSGQVGVVGIKRACSIARLLRIALRALHHHRATHRGYSTVYTLAKLAPSAQTVKSPPKIHRNSCRVFAQDGIGPLMRGGIPAAAIAHRDLQRHVKRVCAAHLLAY